MNIRALACGLLLVASPSFAANVDGKWTGTLDTPNGPVQLSFALKADGATLTGSTTGPDGNSLMLKNGKVDGDKITFTEMKGKGEKGEEKTYTVASTVKVNKGKFNPDTKALEAGDALEGGLKNEMFSKIGEKGLRATIITNDDNKVTEIRVGGGRGKKKQ